MIFVAATAGSDGRSVRLDLPGPPTPTLTRQVEPGRAVAVGLRPEHLRLDPEGAQIRLPVRAVESTGSLTYCTTEGEPGLMFVARGRRALQAGDVAEISMAPADIHLFDRDTGAIP
jgi:multiple sugar transport system ATP-binding protein